MTANILTSQLKASITWLNNQPLALTNVVDQSQLAYDESLADGTAADQADRIWSGQLTLAASGTASLDLTALTETVFGGTITTTLAKCKAILAINTATGAGDSVDMKSSASNGFTAPFSGSAGSVNIGVDSTALLSAKQTGWTVDSTHKSLDFVNNGSDTVIVNVVILGTSA